MALQVWGKTYTRGSCAIVGYETKSSQTLTCKRTKYTIGYVDTAGGQEF